MNFLDISFNSPLLHGILQLEVHLDTFMIQMELMTLCPAPARFQQISLAVLQEHMGLNMNQLGFEMEMKCQIYSAACSCITSAFCLQVQEKGDMHPLPHSPLHGLAKCKDPKKRMVKSCQHMFNFSLKRTHLHSNMTDLGAQLCLLQGYYLAHTHHGLDGAWS